MYVTIVYTHYIVSIPNFHLEVPFPQYKTYNYLAFEDYLMMGGYAVAAVGEREVAKCHYQSLI